MTPPDETLVMVVDDEVDLCEIIGTFLNDWGYRVLTCTSGNQAIRTLETLRVDLIVSDVTMTDGDGEALLEFVTSRAGRHPPVILVTARDDTRKRLLRGGAYAVLGKPCDFDDLHALVTKALGRA